MAYIFRDETLQSGGIAVEPRCLAVVPDDVVAYLLPVCAGIDVCDGIDYAPLPEGNIRVPICSRTGHDVIQYTSSEIPAGLTCM